MSIIPYMNNIITLILGGGKGTRIYPLTKERSKPAIPIGGKYRVIDIPISNCINSNLLKIFVLTQFNSKSLNQHINETYRFDHFSQGFVDILPAGQTTENEDWYLGTADAVRKNLKYLDSYPECDTVLILSGDQIYRMNYRELYQKHLEQNADVTIAMLPVDEEQVKHFGIMKVETNEEKEYISNFIEKTNDPQIIKEFVTPQEYLNSVGIKSTKKQFLASMGIYMFKREVLFEYLNENNDLDFGKQIIPSLIKEKNVVPFFFNGYWEDIGTIRSFHRANIDLLGKNPKFKIYDPNAPIYTNPRFLQAAYVEKSSIENSIIAEGSSVINSDLKNCVIGVRSNIRSGSKLENVLMLGADWFEEEGPKDINQLTTKIPMGIGKNCTIKDAIVDKNVRIGNNVQIINKEKYQDYADPNGKFIIDEGITVIPKGAVIPDNTVI